MEGMTAIYLGRIVDKENFRVFVYGANGEKTVAESWDEFEAKMQSGIWFATVEDAKASKTVIENVEPLEPVEQQPNSKRKYTKKPKTEHEPAFIEEVYESQEIDSDNGMVFEVTDDLQPTGN